MPRLKIHIAGTLAGRVQKCTRCATRMDGNRIWIDVPPTGWKAGALVSSDGRGNMGVISAAQAATIRACGKEVA